MTMLHKDFKVGPLHKGYLTAAPLGTTLWIHQYTYLLLLPKHEKPVTPQLI